MLIYLKSIIKYILFSSFLYGCSLFDRKIEKVEGYGSAFSKGHALVMARAYDQLSQLEQAILSIQEYLKPNKNMPITPPKELTASKLYNCLQKLKALNLVYTQRNKIYPSKLLIASLENLEKDLESWRYK